jgi:hypothetical protein
MNLFLSTRKLTSAGEDHLTEFFAAALSISADLREAYFNFAIRDFALHKKWTHCSIADVRTQRLFEDSNCCPDMVLTLTNGKVIVCEHKLEAPETRGSEMDDRLQLARYLDLPKVDGLIYVRASTLVPDAHVLGHAKYIKPVKREHFLWRDFYALFEDATDPFISWMKEGFEHLGFTAPHEQIGDLKTEADQRNFAKLWDKTCHTARRMGWHVEPGSIVQLYLDSEDKSTLAGGFFVQPTGGGFMLRADPRKDRKDECFEAMAAASNSFSKDLVHAKKTIARQARKVTVYDVYASSAEVLGKERLSVEELEARLERFVSHFLNAVRPPLSSK